MSQPPFDIKVTGARELEDLAKRLKAAGAKDLRNELRRNITAETKELRQEIKQSALDNLPSRGGLNRWAARMPSAQVKTAGNRVGVNIKLARKGHDMEALNRGRLRHPVFGHEDRWVEQSIEPGFFDKPIPKHEEGLRNRILDAIRAIGERI